MTKPINIPKDFAEQLPETIAELQRKQAYYSKLEKAADEVKAAAEKYTQILEQWENSIWESEINNKDTQTIYSSQKDDIQEEDSDLDENNSSEENNEEEVNSLNEENNEVSQEDNNNQETTDLNEDNSSEENNEEEVNSSNEENNEISQEDNNNQETTDLSEDNSSEEEVNNWPKINLNNFLHKQDKDNEVE